VKVKAAGGLCVSWALHVHSNSVSIRLELALSPSGYWAWQDATNKMVSLSWVSCCFPGRWSTRI
jgi:hypothetical protein